MVSRKIGPLLGIVALSTFMLVLRGPVPARADDSPLKRPVEAFYSNDEPALSTILRFGRENNIALGLVVGDQLCSTTITAFRVEHATVEVVLRTFGQKLPSYRWDVENGAVVFAPDNIPEPVAKFLAVVPPPYVIAADTLQGQAALAWMDIRAALRPQEGTAFSVLSSPQSVKWPVLAVRDVTVRELLNRLVARNKGGAWVVFPFRDLDAAADHRPFWLLDYTENVPIQAGLPPCGGSQHP